MVYVLTTAAFYSTTAIYAEGVGLGASKGKEVGKYSAGYAGYAEAVRDAVSKRHLLMLWMVG